MSITGIEMPEEVLNAYERVKLDESLRGITIAIINEALVVDHMIKEEFDPFVNSRIKDDVPRFIIYDFMVPNKSGIFNKLSASMIPIKPMFCKSQPLAII